jgi:hypothetical protein
VPVKESRLGSTGRIDIVSSHNQRRETDMDMMTSPPKPAIGAEIDGPGRAYFDQVVTDNIMDALVEMAAEMWTIRDRMHILESVLADKGIDAAALIEAHVPSPEINAERKALRDAFIARVFNSFVRRPG